MKAIETISGTIQRIDEISSVIASSIEEQGAATGEIAQNVQQAAIGTQEVSANITTVNRAAAETGRVSTEIAQAANDLDMQATHLEVPDGRVRHQGTCRLTKLTAGACHTRAPVLFTLADPVRCRGIRIADREPIRWTIFSRNS